RLPPGDLVGSGLVGSGWLTSSRASTLQAGEPRPSTEMFCGQSGMHTSSSPVTFVAPEGRSLRIGETERLVAKNSVAWSSWTAGEPVTGLERTTGLWDDSLRPKENSRSKPHAFSQAEELRAGSGSTQRLADAGPQTDERFSGMPGAVIGSMLLSSSGSL